MKNVLLVILTYMSSFCSAQKEDYVWLSGNQSSAGYDTSWHHLIGITKLDFNSNPRTVTYDSLGIDFFYNSVSYSDSSGQLVLYSNAIGIRNKWDEVIENGDTLGNGFFMNQLGILAQIYSKFCLLIPLPDTSNQFVELYVFHDTLPGGLFIRNKIMEAYIDMNANNGHGKVMYKDRVIITDDSLSLMPNLTPVKHGNGRDWWVLVKQNVTNCYHRVLVGKHGTVLQSDMSCLGDSTLYSEYGAVCFSPDGTKFAMLNTNNWENNSKVGVHLYNFDRCSGLLSKPIFKPLPFLADSTLIVNDVVFSPNSRFLYTMLGHHIYQFDTYAADVWNSLDTIAEDGDTFLDPFPTGYCYSQLAPDGKIYISSGNGTSNYSYIDSPDVRGPGCGFRAHALHTPSYQNSVPNFPNYRLGKLVGSACDTLHNGLFEVNAVHASMFVYPNPTHESVTVDYGGVDWSTRDELQLHITDIVGKELYTTYLSRFSAIKRVSTTDFASGMYLISLSEINGQVLATKKVVKE